MHYFVQRVRSNLHKWAARLCVLIAESNEGVQVICGVGGQYIESNFCSGSLKHPPCTTLKLKLVTQYFFSIRITEANKMHYFSTLF